MKKFTKVLAFLLVLTLMLSLFPLSVSAATVTDRESNDSIAEAQSITLGDTITGSIPEKYDTDYYSFTLTEAGKVTFTVTAYIEYYSVLLFDPDGTRLWTFGPNSNANRWNPKLFL